MGITFPTLFGEKGANLCLQNRLTNVDSSIFLLVQRWTLIVLLARIDAAVRCPFCLIGKWIIFYFRRLLISPLLARFCASAFARAAAFARPIAVAAGACAQHVRRRDGDEFSVVRLGERHRSLACCPAVVVVATRVAPAHHRCGFFALLLGALVHRRCFSASVRFDCSSTSLSYSLSL